MIKNKKLIPMKKISLVIIAVILASCSRNHKDYDASGMFEATEIIVSAEATGKIIQWDITEGQQVTAGQTLGLIDTAQLYFSKLQILQNKSQTATRKQNIIVQLAAIQEQINYQENEKQRLQRLIQANAANTKQLDDIDAQIAVLQKQYAAQRENLEKSNQAVSDNVSLFDTQLEQINDQLMKSWIKSPIQGTVLVKYTEYGEVAVVGKPLFKVANLDSLYLRAYVTSAQLTELKLGQQVTVMSDFGERGTRNYEGIITWISTSAEFTPKTIQTKDERANLVYAIKILVKNDGYLKIGMYGDVKFKSDTGK